MQERKRALAWCVLVLLVGLPALGATVETIPKPAAERGSWSVDTTATLRPETLAEVDRLGTQLDASGKGQLALVVVDSTEGRQPRAFATELFNRWGVGNADRDDGALVFIALKDRKLEIVLGDGVDTAADVERSDAVMARMVSLFKSGDLDATVLEGTRGVSSLLTQSSLGTLSAAGGSATADARNREHSPEDSGGASPIAFFFIALLAGILALAMRKRDPNEPRKPRPPSTTYWGGGFFGGGGGFSGGGGGGFGGGSSSGGGSSGSG